MKNKIYYVDVGDMSKKEAEKILKKEMNIRLTPLLPINPGSSELLLKTIIVFFIVVILFLLGIL